MAYAHQDGCGFQEFIGDRPYKLAKIQVWLEKYFQWDSFDVVVYERPFHRGPATRVLWGIAGILEAVAIRSNAVVFDVAVPTIKKFATGSGRAFKNEMIDAAQRRFDYPGNNEHEADALCLYHYALANVERVEDEQPVRGVRGTKQTRVEKTKRSRSRKAQAELSPTKSSQ